MKILSLYFKNINSLEGESRIYFDRAPIVDGGVFAITGPNGSGKSSVLDAITLGLYGETFRFDRPAEHVMTKETAESFAEVDFSLGTDKYRATWHVKREGDLASGVLLPAEMTLVALNGSEQVIEQNTHNVRDKMAELTGMDFHKFSKSMVLAQGDFAAFLNALDSERMDILEKISGADIYADYKKQAEEKHSQAQTLLQQLEQDLSATPVMDAISLEASEDDLDDFKQQQSDLNQQTEEIQQQLNWYQNITDLTRQQEKLLTQQQQVKAQLDKNQQTLEQIDSAQSVAVFEQDVVLLDSKAEAVQQSKSTLDAYRRESASLQQRLKSENFDDNAVVGSEKSPAQQKQSIDDAKLKLSGFNFELPTENTLLHTLELTKDEQDAALVTTEHWLQEHLLDKGLLDSFPEIEKLVELRTEIVGLTEKQKGYSKWSKNITASLAKKKAEIVTRTKTNADLTVQLALGEKALPEISNDHSLQDLKEMQIEQQERIANFLELYDLATVNAKLANKGFFGQLFSFKSVDKEEQQLKQEIEQLQLQIGKENNVVTVLEQAINNEMLLQKMQNDRQHLVDGKPCPLCGALEHPFAEHAPAVSNSKKVLADQQKELKRLVADEIKSVKQLVVVQQQSEKEVENDSKLLIVISQWNNLANRLNVANAELDIENTSMMKDLLKEERKDLNNLTNLLKRYIKQQNSNEQAKTAIETNLVVLTRLEEETASLALEWDNRPEESKEIEQVYNESQAQEKILAEKILQQLTQLNEKMPAKGKEGTLLNRLTVRKQDVQMHLERQKLLAEELRVLDGKITDCRGKIAKINDGIQQSSEMVLQQEMAGLHLSLIEKQKLIAEKEALFSQQENEMVGLKKTLFEAIKDSPATDIDELKSLLSLIQRQPEMQKKHEQLQLSESDIENKLTETVQQLETDQAIGSPEATEYELNTQRRNAREKLDITKQEIHSLRSKLDRQDSLKERYQGILAKLERQKAEVKITEADMDLITDNNGVHFRRKVQQVLTDKLLSQTNQVLEKISGRYYVRKVESEHGLALEIEDTKQHNARRLPKTLSGGESFVVSLSLALGLAEMASNEHAVDSLFLDEGFGNLDAESLYLAMTTLESLKTHGKLVGVISHVEGVQKRIKTQIEMVKKPNGLSALKMVS